MNTTNNNNQSNMLVLLKLTEITIRITDFSVNGLFCITILATKVRMQSKCIQIFIITNIKILFTQYPLWDHSSLNSVHHSWSESSSVCSAHQCWRHWVSSEISGHLRRSDAVNKHWGSGTRAIFMKPKGWKLGFRFPHTVMFQCVSLWCVLSRVSSVWFIPGVLTSYVSVSAAPC